MKETRTEKMHSRLGLGLWQVKGRRPLHSSSMIGIGAHDEAEQFHQSFCGLAFSVGA